MILPYLSDDLPLVKNVLKNTEKARTWDAVIHQSPGLYGSLSDALDDYNNTKSMVLNVMESGLMSADIVFESFAYRKSFVSPAASFAIFLHNKTAGFCW